MVLKSEIEAALKAQIQFFKKKSSGQKRDALKEIALPGNHILIITGIRRCGKSTLLHQISETLTEDYVFFNFEDPRIFGFEATDFKKLNEVIGDHTNHYFFDEIQNIEKWEVFIRNLHDQGKKICITGSNASLLSKELGTRLTGRNLQIELFPFSYTEYCKFKKLKENNKSFLAYLQDGGFPDYVKSGQKEQLQQLFKDIIYRDIIVRHGIRNAKVLVDIALFLISNSGKEYSLNSLAKTYRIGSVNSVINYVQWLEDSYVLFSLPRFSWSLKSISKNPKKIYTIDTGFAQANSLSFTKDTGRLFENAVYLELRRKYQQLYYFREKGECDFVVQEGKKIKHLIQVCTEVHSENMQREVNGLIEALNFFDKEEGIILTLDQEDELDQDNKLINLIPAWKWLNKA